MYFPHGPSCPGKVTAHVCKTYGLNLIMNSVIDEKKRIENFYNT